MDEIIIACPSCAATGGPELLHQLCCKLRRLNYRAYMYYYDYDSKKYNTPVHDRYIKYNNDYVLEYNDNVHNIIIIPEVASDLLKIAPKARKVFWWLSVDNFYYKKSGILGKIKSSIKNNTRIKAVKNDNIFHFVQSYYAKDHCYKIGINTKKIFYLSDYLSNDFIEKSHDNALCKKNNVVLYNPKKGYEFTRLLIKEAPQLEWIPLINLGPDDIINLMKQSKVYIDFGNHPGKDRIPREAALCGCCVIVGKKGSAKFQEDIDIPSVFKFEANPENITEIISKIYNVFKEYEKESQSFNKYRKIIREEEKKFEEDVCFLFSDVLKGKRDF